MSEFFELFGVLGAIAAAGGLGYLLVGVVHLTLRRMERRAQLQPESDSEQQLADLEARVQALERLATRLGELEERVDFAERQLTRDRPGQRLPPAAH